MNLTEGQLFTIEALNKIDDFVWPEHASRAWMNKDKSIVCFTMLGGSCVLSIKEGLVYKGIYASGINESSKHPDWRNSLITREQFDSVDGWVRVDKDSLPIINSEVAIDIKHFHDGDGFQSGSLAKFIKWDGVKLWRYHKPTKEIEVQPEAPKQPSIDELYSQYKAQRGIVESAKKTLADEMEAEDKLLEQIKAWNLEYGFDVRLLDESEEKTELVITDWRDLQAGDVIWWFGDASNDAGEYEVCAIEDLDYDGEAPISVNTLDGGSGWVNVKVEPWKFIRRP
ncbi:MAG: hypothetical protein ACRDC4_15535 [Plesiomonas sp.]